MVDVIMAVGIVVCVFIPFGGFILVTTASVLKWSFGIDLIERFRKKKQEDNND